MLLISTTVAHLIRRSHSFVVLMQPYAPQLEPCRPTSAAATGASSLVTQDPQLQPAELSMRARAQLVLFSLLVVGSLCQQIGTLQSCPSVKSTPCLLALGAPCWMISGVPLSTHSLHGRDHAGMQ